MSKRKKTEPLNLPEFGDAITLPNLKKRLMMKGTNKALQPKAMLFDNWIGVITIEELAVIFRLAPQTIRNWVALGKIPHVKIGRRYFFQRRSLQEWLNHKEKPQWQ